MAKQANVAAVAPSLVRTATPFVVGLIGSAISDALGVDGGQSNAVIAAVIGYAYYVAARFAEVFLSDRWGYVLGVRGMPTYGKTTPDLPPTETDDERELRERRES